MTLPAILGGRPAFSNGLPFARPMTPSLEVVTKRLSNSYEDAVLTNGRLVRELEEEAAAWLGVRHVVAVASCTSGLILTLQALAPGRPVVLPSFTFSASAHAVAWNAGATVFADCELATAQVDPADVARLLPGTGAILATHVFGAPCQAERLEAMARRAGIPIVFDAAHGFGATHQGRAVGGFGDAEVFSMSPTKLVIAGEGGLVATNRDDVAEHIRLGRDYGNPGDYNTRFVGLNARLSEFHAAVALESLAILPEHLFRRRELADLYRAALAGIEGLATQFVSDGDESTYKDFTVRIDEHHFGISRDAVVEGLSRDGVETRQYFSPPVHLQGAYAHVGKPKLAVTECLAGQVVSLPIYPSLTEGDIRRVADVLIALHDFAPRVRDAQLLAG